MKRIGRRPLFFGAVTLVCVLMLAVMPSDLRYVDVWAGCLAAFWAVLLYFEDRSMSRAAERRRRGPEESDADT